MCIRDRETPTETPLPPTLTPTPVALAQPLARDTNAREGPSIDYPIIGKIQPGSTFETVSYTHLTLPTSDLV